MQKRRRHGPTPRWAGATMPRRRQRCFCLGIASPTAGLDPERRVEQETSTTYSVPNPSHEFTWFQEDFWTEVVKHLCGMDLLRLSFTCKNLMHIMADDSLWRTACVRDLGLCYASQSTTCHLDYSWKMFYFNVFLKEKHPDGWRVGGLLISTPEIILTTKIPLSDLVLLKPPDSAKTAGVCVLNNARLGLWIINVKGVDCTGCGVDNCTGRMQVMAAHHSDIYLKKEYWDESLVYEVISEEYIDEEVPIVRCGIFVLKGLNSSSMTGVRTVMTRESEDQQARTCLSSHMVTLSSIPAPNNGLFSRFEVLRDNGQIVAVQISQSLISIV